MRKLVVIDLGAADTPRFERYERQVLPLLGRYGARLELAVRSLDGASETHVLHFPDAAAFERFLSDPDRAALREEWALAGAKATIADVERVEYP